MKDKHLTDKDLKRLLEGESEPRNRLLLHHLAMCGPCYAVAGHILDLYIAGEVGLDLCTIDIALGKSRREAPALWDELRVYPFEGQRALIRGAERFRSWGLCELLCYESEKEAPQDPGRARALAELAVAVSSVMDDWEPVEPLWRDELRAYALAHFANTCRVLGDLRSAEEAFAAAEALWKPAHQNMGDVLDYEAHYLALLASLRRAQRKLPEALELLDLACAANPSPSLLARILINKAKTLEELGDISGAVEVLEEARSQAGEEVDARLHLCLVQNRLDYLSKSGRLIEAEISASDVETLVRKIGSEIDLLRLRWTQARIAGSLGRPEESLRLFQEARAGFARHELPYDMALVSLELALACVNLKRGGEAFQIIQETLPVLRGVSVEREGLMAVQLLAEAAAEKRLTAELIGNILEYLRRSLNEKHASGLVP